MKLPIPGVPWPYEGTENIMDPTEFSDMISWGIVDGTNIGYIYALAWTAEWYLPGFNIANQFYDAINNLMNIHHVDGLIIDQRLNYGGQMQFQKGFSLLFNHRFTVLALDKRSDPDDHFAMSPDHYWGEYFITNGNPATFHD